MGTTVEDFVEAELKAHKIVVFSKSWCPFCKKAKDVLNKYNLPKDIYEVIELDDNPNVEEIQDYMQKKTGASSVPRVFINGKCIGGGDDTVKLEKNGELKKMLQAIGAVH